MYQVFPRALLAWGIYTHPPAPLPHSGLAVVPLNLLHSSSTVKASRSLALSVLYRSLWGANATSPSRYHSIVLPIKGRWVQGGPNLGCRHQRQSSIRDLLKALRSLSLGTDLEDMDLGTSSPIASLLIRSCNPSVVMIMSWTPLVSGSECDEFNTMAP